jgi:hypothetical protein
MSIKCSGIAKLSHDDSGKTVTVQCNQLDWKVVEVVERSMGAEVHHRATVEVNLAGEVYSVSWDLWEYPDGVLNQKETESNELEIIQDLSLGIMQD